MKEHTLWVEKYRPAKLVKGSAAKRTKLSGLKRNIKFNPKERNHK